MSGRTFVEIRCDAEPDGPMAPPCMTPASVDGVSSLRELRARIRPEGWHHTRHNRDICPACWAEGHR